jgi:hypothetical protein
MSEAPVSNVAINKISDGWLQKVSARLTVVGPFGNRRRVPCTKRFSLPMTAQLKDGGHCGRELESLNSAALRYSC